MPLTSYNPDNYQHLLKQKVDRIRTQFKKFSLPEIEVFASPPSHYRMRAEFRVWHENDDSYYIMFTASDDTGKGDTDSIPPKHPVKIQHQIDQFPVASQAINQIMASLMASIKLQDIMRKRLFQANFFSTTRGEMLVTLIYHKKLCDQWLNAATAITKDLSIRIIGRSKKQKLVIGEEYITEELCVLKENYRYQQREGGFTQPNASISQDMLNWVAGQCQTLNTKSNDQQDFLELYCGNGNFCIPMAKHFRRALATEVSKTSVHSAQHNIKLNKIKNLQILRMSSEEFSSALNGEREFRRLRDIDLNNFNFSTILVDPPRAGLDEKTEKLICQFDHIFYISCNPDTLERNLLRICQSHDIIRFALFDQFPYTQHVECGVFLTCKDKSKTTTNST